LKDKIPDLPSLLQLQDFIECGLVYKCVKNNPNISDSEVARQTRLLVSRVAILRAYLEYQQDLPERAQVFSNASASLEKEADVVDDTFEDEELGFPVQLNMDYIGRISSINQNGVGIALIDTFPCIDLFFNKRALTRELFLRFS
jgi:hypothetical protein